MNRFLKLVHYELQRFRKMYLSLLVVTLLLQFAGVFLQAWDHNKQVKMTLIRESMTLQAYAQKFGTIDFSRYLYSFWFMAPIALCAASLLLYVFLIWYRDWLSRNQFIYRLLMLPSSRNYIFMAKAVVILLMVWGFIAFQLMILPLEKAVLNTLVDGVFKDTTSVVANIANHDFLSILLPQTLLQFLIYYGVGIMGVLVLFTAILLERSYRWKGIAAGLVYCVLAGTVFLLPLLISEIVLTQYFYANEVIILEGISLLLVSCISIGFSFFLLNKRVTV